MISWQNEKIFQDQQFFLTSSILFSLRKGRDLSFEQKGFVPMMTAGGPLVLEMRMTPTTIQRKQSPSSDEQENGDIARE